MLSDTSVLNLFTTEIGVIFQVPRTATVLSKGRSLIAVLQHDELQSLIVDYPDIADDIADEAMKRYDEQIRKRNSKKPQLQRESDRHLVDFFRSNVAKVYSDGYA